MRDGSLFAGIFLTAGIGYLAVVHHPAWWLVLVMGLPFAIAAYVTLRKPAND